MKEKVSVVSAGALPERVKALVEASARLVTMVGTDERESDGSYILRYMFRVPAGQAGEPQTAEPQDATGTRDAAASAALETLLVRLDPTDPSFPSVTPILPAAQWYEREVQDLLGLVPMGHPDPRPLVLHEPWPPGYYPLRKDFVPPTAEAGCHGEPGRPPEINPRVVGEGIIAIPVGPIHAGIIEPGHFRFGAVGESVLHLEARLFYTHRGLEKQAEGKDLDEGLFIAERMCGACNVSHAISYCQAVENALGLQVPRRAAYLRTLYLELERLYNHVGDVGNVCAGVGFAFGVSHGSRLKEKLQRLNAELTGHRFLRGAQAVGGVRQDLFPEAVRRMEAVLREVEAEFDELTEVLFSNTSVMDRFATTGVLSPQVARDLGVVGVAARASGLPLDARRDWPHAAYDELPFSVVTKRAGDVLARVRVRVGEVAESLAIIRAALAGLPKGDVRLDPADVIAAAAAAAAGAAAASAHAAAAPGAADGTAGWRTGLGITESPRGENVHWVMLAPDGRIARLRVRSASFTNWPAVPLTVPGNIVPDFPLINKSFELCYSCLDR